MAEVLLFHHVHGLTKGTLDFADLLRNRGHVVHAPDLYEGRTFATLGDGLAHARAIGFPAIVARGARAAATLSSRLVYAGFSLGVMPAQMLAQTRAGARGALLFHGCVPFTEFSPHWPAAVPVQVHAMERDSSFVDEGDLDAARALLEETAAAELFLYPGNRHLFADSSLAEYDADATRLLVSRVVDFLAACRPC